MTFVQISPSPSIHTDTPQNKRILFLVSEHISLKSLASIEMALVRHGAEVRRVTNCFEAERLAWCWNPKVIVLLGWPTAMADWILKMQASLHLGDLSFVVVGIDLRGYQADKNAIAALEVGKRTYIHANMRLRDLTDHVCGLLTKSGKQAPVRLIQDEILCIDLVSIRAWIFGQEIHIPRRFFYLLYYFAIHPGEIVSNEKITDILWAGKLNYISSNAKAVNIYRLRKILESAGAIGWLKTIHNYGYLFLP